MASPIGHSLAGYGIYSAANKKIKWKELLVFIILANLADIDYLFGFLVGAPNKYHHQFTHSFLIAVLIAVLFGLIISRLKQKRFLNFFWLFFAVYFSHVVIDYFTLDTSMPYGEQLCWPFSSKYFISPVSIFMDVQKANTTAEFIPSLFSKHNFLMMFSEIGIFGVLCFLIKLIRRSLFANGKLAE